MKIEFGERYTTRHSCEQLLDLWDSGECLPSWLGLLTDLVMHILTEPSLLTTGTMGAAQSANCLNCMIPSFSSLTSSFSTFWHRENGIGPWPVKMWMPLQANLDLCGYPFYHS